MTSTNETTVHNKKTEEMGPDDVYIGRGSIWGNPFSHRGVQSRFATIECDTPEEAIERYREHIIDRLYHDRELQLELIDLRGKRLFCFCKPGPCHGDVLAELCYDFEVEAR